MRILWYGVCIRRASDIGKKFHFDSCDNAPPICRMNRGVSLTHLDPQYGSRVLFTQLSLLLYPFYSRFFLILLPKNTMLAYTTVTGPADQKHHRQVADRQFHLFSYTCNALA